MHGASLLGMCVIRGNHVTAWAVRLFLCGWLCAGHALSLIACAQAEESSGRGESGGKGESGSKGESGGKGENGGKSSGANEGGPSGGPGSAEKGLRGPEGSPLGLRGPKLPSEQDLAREAVANGWAKTLNQILPTVQKKIAGDILDVRLNKSSNGTWIYNFIILSPDRRYIMVAVDATRNIILEIRGR
ncbi:MAG: PepSY domain-containing protein [Beijerinckiaceae bacterium]